MVALASWKAAARFCPMSTNVERKIASRDTTSVSIGHGVASIRIIHPANRTTWM